MVKTFSTLIEDIHAYLGGDHVAEDFKLDGETAKNIIDMAKRLSTHTLEIVDHRPREPKATSDKTVRMSELGEPCLRKLMMKWYSPHLGLPPHAEKGNPTLPIKFLFGDYMEELVLFLAKEAGHAVMSRQAEYSYHPNPALFKAVGHIDAIIDEYVVDVKSAADVSFQKYKREGLTALNDTFGYRYQLDGYAKAIGNYKRAFIFINKHDGELLVIGRSSDPFVDIDWRIGEITDAANGIVPTVKRDTVEDLKGFGDKLDVVCSYCNFKWSCQAPKHAFVVSGRPVYYTKLTKQGEKFYAGKTQIPAPSF